MAKTKKGNRPSYIRAASHEHAIPLYNSFIEYSQKFLQNLSFLEEIWIRNRLN